MIDFNLPGTVSIVTSNTRILASAGEWKKMTAINGIITYDEIVNVDFSPRDMGAALLLPRIPSSQPVHRFQPYTRHLKLEAGYIPLITRPTPIRVTRSPRPMDESNLKRAQLRFVSLWTTLRAWVRLAVCPSYFLRSRRRANLYPVSDSALYASNMSAHLCTPLLPHHLFSGYQYHFRAS